MRSLAGALLAGAVLFALMPGTAMAYGTTTVSIDGPRLLIDGDEDDNLVDAQRSNSAACPGGPPCFEVDSGGGDTLVAVPPCVGTPPPADVVRCPTFEVQRIVFVGHGGEEYYEVGPLGPLAVSVTMRGDRGEDHLEGSVRRDLLIGGTEGDDIYSEGGRDRVLAQDGEDAVRAGRGRDRINGGPGHDFLRGGRGNDRILGKAGPDSLFGGFGVDFCNGGSDPPASSDPADDHAHTCETVLNVP